MTSLGRVGVLLRACETTRPAAHDRAPDVRGRSWRPGADHSQKACAACGTVAIRREDPAEPRGYRIAYLGANGPSSIVAHFAASEEQVNVERPDAA
jgi:hypothetical protein